MPGTATVPRRVEDWVVLLEALSTQLVQGRIYTRDLPVLIPALNRVFDVTQRRIAER